MALAVIVGLESLSLTQPPGYPQFIVATTTLPVPFGDHTSLYLLEKKPSGWTLVLQQAGDAQMGLDWRISSPAGEEPFLVTASTRPAEWGSWQPLRLRVMRPGPDPAHPIVLLDAADSFQISEPWLLSAEGGSFLLRYQGHYHLDARRWGRFKVARFVVRGDTVTREDPIAETADEFVDEWFSLPWKEARRWTPTAERTRLKKWHDRLNAGKKHSTEVDINPCESDGAARYEVTLAIEPNGDPLPDQLVALVERTGDRFVLRDLDPDAAWDGNAEERVKCPRRNEVLTAAMGDVDGDGKRDRVEIVLKDGFHSTGPSEDFNCPNDYNGTFVARVSLGERIVETKLDVVAVCAGPWDLRLGDYNRDGRLDFNIGLRENSANSFYSLFTIGRDGGVASLRVRHADGSVDDSITAATTGNSTDFIIAADGIRARSLSNPADPAVAFWTTVYRWRTKEAMFEEGEQIAIAATRTPR